MLPVVAASSQPALFHLYFTVRMHSAPQSVRYVTIRSAHSARRFRTVRCVLVLAKFARTRRDSGAGDSTQPTQRCDGDVKCRALCLTLANSQLAAIAAAAAATVLGLERRHARFRRTMTTIARLPNVPCSSVCLMHLAAESAFG